MQRAYYCKLHQNVRRNDVCGVPYCENLYAEENCDPMDQNRILDSMMKCNGRDNAFEIYKKYTGKNLFCTLKVIYKRLATMLRWLKCDIQIAFLIFQF